MARIIGCAVDWTFDQFMEDSKLYKATARKGVHCRRDASPRESFMMWLKGCARDFKEAWLTKHPHLYDRYDGWIGDAFAKTLYSGAFSDFYKDTYGQRPHLDVWYYVQALDLPQLGDTAMTFCAEPVEEAVEQAKRVRAEGA